MFDKLEVTYGNIRRFVENWIILEKSDSHRTRTKQQVKQRSGGGSLFSNGFRQYPGSNGDPPEVCCREE